MNKYGTTATKQYSGWQINGWAPHMTKKHQAFQQENGMNKCNLKRITQYDPLQLLSLHKMILFCLLRFNEELNS